jgi:hypothetical protein
MIWLTSSISKKTIRQRHQRGRLVSYIPSDATHAESLFSMPQAESDCKNCGVSWAYLDRHRRRT